MFYFFSKEFGWSIDQILNCDIFQLEIYANSAVSFNKKVNKKNKSFKDGHSNLAGDRVQIDSINQLMNSKLVNVKNNKDK